MIAELKTALNVALLKHKDMNDVASDKGKTVMAFGILAVSALAAGLGMKFFGAFLSPSWGFVLSSALTQFISAIIGIYVLSIVARSVFKGHAHHDAFFRVLAFGMIVTWLSIFPPLSIVGGIWALVVLFVTLKVIHKLTTGGAIGAILVTIIAMALVMWILTPVMGMLGLGGMYSGGFQFRGGSDSIMNIENDGDFKMHMNTPDGEGSVKMEEGKMVIEGPGGEKMEIVIPDYN